MAGKGWGDFSRDVQDKLQLLPCEDIKKRGGAGGNIQSGKEGGQPVAWRRWIYWGGFMFPKERRGLPTSLTA